MLKQIGNRYAYLEPICIGLALFLIYNATLPINRSESRDSLWYMAQIGGNESLWQLFHPHHLLYSVVARAFYNIWRLFGYTGDASIPLQELNIIFACLIIVTLYILLRNVLKSRWRSLLVCTAVTFSFGFWFYGSTIEDKIIPLFFLLLSFGFLLLSFQRPTLKMFALVGIFNGLAILFHQLNILFAATVLVAIFLNRRRRVIKDKTTAVLTYAGCVSIPVVLAYLLTLAFVIKPGSPAEALYWLTSYAHAGQYGNLELLSPIKGLIGFSHSFLGGHFLFSVEGLGSFISSALSDKSLADQQFLASHTSAFQAKAFLLGIIPLASVFIAALISYVRSWREIWREHNSLLSLSLAWLIPYAVFTAWWEPFNVEFWVVTLIPAWLIISLPFFTSGLMTKMQRGFQKSTYVILPLAIVSMLLVNLFGSMLPLHSPELDYYLQKSSWYSDNAKPGDLIICSRGTLWGEYLRHYTKAEVIGVAETLRKENDTSSIIDQKICQILGSGGLVYITSDAVQPDAAVLKSYGLDAADFAGLWASYRHSWVEVDIAAGDVVYIVSAIR
ncbi:MAG: glycosyltransferase family 39 protein [Chloroflexota bacterium]